MRIFWIICVEKKGALYNLLILSGMIVIPISDKNIITKCLPEERKLIFKFPNFISLSIQLFFQIYIKNFNCLCIKKSRNVEICINLQFENKCFIKLWKASFKT